jgi:hypothetical protein
MVFGDGNLIVALNSRNDASHDASYFNDLRVGSPGNHE